MVKNLLVLGILFCSFFATGHQADLSSTILSEGEDGVWILQIRAALTAYEYEVNLNYGEEAFKTPEEFKELVIQHVKTNISIYIDGGERQVLENAQVSLGHETNVVFFLENFPSDFTTIIISNSSFQDISRNQSALVLLKSGFEKQQFVLNNANNHLAMLEKNGLRFEYRTPEKKPENKSPFNKSLLYGALGMAILCSLLFLIKRNRKVEL